jgi:hypothetical protein
MKKKLLNWMFKLAIKVIAINIVKHGNKLTPDYLITRGWVERNGYYIEQDMKGRDLVSISFEHHYYRVFHSDKRTFVALASTIEWLENYLLLIRPDTLNEKAGI